LSSTNLVDFASAKASENCDLFVDNSLFPFDEWGYRPYTFRAFGNMQSAHNDKHFYQPNNIN